MTQQAAPDPRQQLQSAIQQAQLELGTLQKGARLTNVRDELEDLQTNIAGMPQRVAEVRAKGYVFEKEMEKTAVVLQSKWEPLKPAVLQQITLQSNQMDMEVRTIETLMQQLTARSGNPAVAAPFLSQVQAAISTQQSKISSAESMIRGMVDTLNKETNMLKQHLEHITWAFDQLAASTVRLHAAEGLIEVVEAVWAPNGKEDKDDPKGFLVLTDQRMIFEQDEEIATKKVLFITTAKERVQKQLFEFPVVLIQDIVGSKMGFFKNEDHIDMKLASGAPFPTCHIHLFHQGCEYWDGLIGKVKSGEFDRDRAVVISQDVLDKVKNAPTKCPSCGGTFSKPVLRGQEAITCEFCGAVTRL